MMPIMNILRHWLLKPIYALVFNAIVVVSRVVNALGVSQARITTIRVGAVRIIGPKVGVEIIKRAIDRVKEEDLTLYKCLMCGSKCSILSGSDRNSFSFEYGYVVLGMSYFYSIEGLVSLFVFWGFFGANVNIVEISDKRAMNERVKMASTQTASWLEAKAYPNPVIQWMSKNGLEKNMNPPRSSKKAKRTQEERTQP